MHFFVRLRDWKVGTRLAFGFGLILTLLCVVALLGMLGIERSRSLHHVFEEALVVRQQGSQVNTLLQQDLVKTQAIIRSAGMPEVVERFKPELQAADQTIAQVLKKMADNPVAAVQASAQALHAQHQRYLGTRNEVLDLVETGQTMQAADKENAGAAARGRRGEEPERQAPAKCRTTHHQGPGELRQHHRHGAVADRRPDPDHAGAGHRVGLVHRPLGEPPCPGRHAGQRGDCRGSPVALRERGSRSGRTGPHADLHAPHAHQPAAAHWRSA